MISSKPSRSSMPSGFRPIGFCRSRSAPCSSARSGVHPPRGLLLLRQLPLSGGKLEDTAAGGLPRSSGIKASFIPASAASSPTCRDRLKTLSPSTAGAAPASSGSKKARARIRCTRGCHAGCSQPTLSGFSFTLLPTISATFCAPPHTPTSSTEEGYVQIQEADQDRREGRQPRPLCRLPIGRGRYPEASLR